MPDMALCLGDNVQKKNKKMLFRDRKNQGIGNSDTYE